MSRNYGGSMVANMFVKFGADTEEYQKKMRAAVTRMLFAAESLTQAGRILSTAVTAPLLMVGAASLKVAMQFEASMNKMEALVGMPAETIARWKPVILDMAGTVGKSANELAEALFFITSNGIQTDAALRVLEATAKASAIGMGETKDIAIAATSAMNAFGKGALTADEAVAVLIGTVREGNLEAAELPQALSKLLPIAAAMGIEFHEAGAGIAAMSRSGTTARLAAFGLRAIMMGLLDPTVSASAAMAKVDLSSAKLKATLAGPNGLRIALLQIKEATENSSVTLKDILPNQKAFSAALQLLGKNTEDYVDISKNMAKIVGEDVDNSFRKGAKTMKRTYEMAMGDLSAAAVRLGDNMVPLVDRFGNLANQVSDTARAYNELNDYWKGLISTATLSLMALGPVLYALGSLARMTARFTGLSILFKLAWVKNAAALMTTRAAAVSMTKAGGALGASLGSIAGGAATALVVGYQFGKWLDHTFGITKALDEEFGRFGDAVSSVGDALEADAEKMWTYTNASHRLAMAIGEVNLAHELADARSAGNTKKVAELTAEIEKKANAYNKARIKVGGLTDAEEKFADGQQAIKDAQAEIDAEEGERLKKLRETHGLLTSQDVIDKMTELGGQYKDHINSGVKQEMVNERLKEDALKLVELAKEYGIEVTQGIKDMTASMHETGDIKDNEFYKLFDYYIPNAINAIPGKMIHGMATMGDEVATKLTGGLDRGFADGITNYNDLYRPQIKRALEATYREGFTGVGDELRDRIQGAVELLGPLEVDIIPNVDAFMTLYQDIQGGKIPDTGG